jgi:hypothetical protein
MLHSRQHQQQLQIAHRFLQPQPLATPASTPALTPALTPRSRSTPAPAPLVRVRGGVARLTGWDAPNVCRHADRLCFAGVAASGGLSPTFSQRRVFLGLDAISTA